MMRTFILLIAFSLLTTGFHLYADGEAVSAVADIVDAQGGKIGHAALLEMEEGVQVTAEVEKLAPGLHGFHIHEVGSCEAPDFQSAGGHFNPSAKKHGLASPEGAHAGDMPNLLADASGSGKLETMAWGATLSAGPYSLLDSDGSAVVIHASPDDYATDPAGNAGARIACGVISAE
jgi:Cu-Zn family superoxide dismutase